MFDQNKQLDYARQVVGGDPMARFMGFMVEDVAPSRAVVSLTPRDHHLNGLGLVHGAAISALVDQAVAVAANTLEGTVLLFETKINFLARAEPGRKLTATAQALDNKRKIGLWEVRVSAPDGGLVALAQTMSYRQSSRPGV